MRVLITGAAGQVGHELLQSVPSGFKVLGMGSSELDITNATRVDAVITSERPHLIINAAAYTAVDKAEDDSAAAYAVNSEGIANLGLAAARNHIPVLHISTDYVFDGNTSKSYSETDATDPQGVYGASKLAGEHCLIAENPRHIILRTSWVFGSHGHNFVKTMLRLGCERGSLSVVSDQTGCPTSAASIATALWHIAECYRDEGSLKWGVYHFCGGPSCTWYEFAQEIFQQASLLGLLDSRPTLNAIKTEDYSTRAKRPSWSVLDCAKILTEFAIERSDWRADLSVMLNARLDLKSERS